MFVEQHSREASEGTAASAFGRSAPPDGGLALGREKHNETKKWQARLS